MKKILILALALLTAALWAPVTPADPAEETAPSTTEATATDDGDGDGGSEADGDTPAAEHRKVELDLGAWDASTEGSPDVVTEYEPDDGGPDIRLDAEALGDWGSLEALARIRHEDDMDLDLDVDFGRTVRTRTTYTELLHRLGHDPLHNFEAATNHGRVVRHTDLDPDQTYEITYSDFRHRTEFQPKTSSALTLAINYRLQERDGHRQALAISSDLPRDLRLRPGLPAPLGPRPGRDRVPSRRVAQDQQESRYGQAELALRVDRPRLLRGRSGGDRNRRERFRSELVGAAEEGDAGAGLAAPR